MGESVQPLVDVIAENQVKSMRGALIEENLSKIGRILESDGSSTIENMRQQRQNLFENVLVKQIKNYTEVYFHRNCIRR